MPFIVVRSHQFAGTRRWLFAAFALLLWPGRVVPAQTLSFSLIPSVERVAWDNSLALEDDWLAGARLALRFGPQIELQPFFYTVNGLDLDPDLTDDVFGAPITGSINDVMHYGANLQWNIGGGRFLPFLRLGGGVMHFESTTGGSQSQIAVSAGGGLRFGTEWVQGELFAEQLAFRMSPVRLLLPDSPVEGRAPTHRNFVYGAAVMLPISQVRDPTGTTGGLRGTTAPIEPFVGQLRYDGDRQLDDQDLFGLRAGIDFSSLFGIRGFYWWGSDGFSGTDPVSGYGGEAQFNLNAGPGISPFLVVGAGRIDYQSDFEGPLGQTPDDETALILGGGATVRLFDRFGLNVALRDYILAADRPLGEVSATDDLTHNTVLSAGLTISIGGSVPEPAQPIAPTTRPPSSAELDSLRAENERLRLAAAARAESLGVDTAALARADTTARVGVPADTLARAGVAVDTAGTDTLLRQLAQAELAAGRRMVVAPAPLQGEVIFRYGMRPTDEARAGDARTAEAPLTLDQIREVVRAELGRDTTPPARDTTPPAGQRAQPALPGQPTPQPTPQPVPPVQPVPQPAPLPTPQPAPQPVPLPQQQPVPQPQPVPQQVAPPRVDTVVMRLPPGALDTQTFEQRMAQMELRLAARFESMLNDRLRTLEATAAAQRTAPAPQPTPAPVTQRESPGEVERPQQQRPTFWSRLGDVGTNNIHPFVGADITDGTSLVISARANLGPLRPGNPFDLVPEVALQFGDGDRSLLALVNLQYAPFGFGPANSIRPYLIGGVGLFSETLVAANTGIGVSYDVQRGRGVPFLVFGEYQGLNLFQYERLLFGFSLTR